jgi:hypothetical protein
MGAVIFTDFWILPRLGMKSNFAELRRLSFSWPAAVAWGGTLLVAFMLPIELFFKGLPGWFICVALYIGGSWLLQRRLQGESAGHVEPSTAGGHVR